MDSELIWFGNEYSPRFKDPVRRPKGINSDGSYGTQQDVPGQKYTFRVGDLCFAAIGQIVNRSLNPMRYQPTACVVINSPLHTPALADAVRQDWSGLTAEQHEAQLELDANSLASETAPDALKRLLYYYPQDGERVALELLSRKPSAYFYGHSCGADNLVKSLRTFASKKINLGIQDLFRRAVEFPPSLDNDRWKLDTLALACAEHEFGRGFDQEYRDFFARRITEARSTPKDSWQRWYLDEMIVWQKKLGG